MFNCVNRDDISYNYCSPYRGDDEWRLKLWLFVAYVVSFVSLAGAVGLLVQDGLTGPSAWTGVAGVLQCVFVLISHFAPGGKEGDKLRRNTDIIEILKIT